MNVVYMGWVVPLQIGIVESLDEFMTVILLTIRYVAQFIRFVSLSSFSYSFSLCSSVFPSPYLSFPFRLFCPLSLPFLHCILASLCMCRLILLMTTTPFRVFGCVWVVWWLCRIVRYIRTGAEAQDSLTAVEEHVIRFDKPASRADSGLPTAVPAVDIDL